MTGIRMLLVGGAVVGTLDILFAIGFWYFMRDVPPPRSTPPAPVRPR